MYKSWKITTTANHIYISCPRKQFISVSAGLQIKVVKCKFIFPTELVYLLVLTCLPALVQNECVI